MGSLNGPTGSLMNNIAANSGQPTPEVGMGATVLGWTDRYPYTIVEILSPRRIVAKADVATRLDSNGMSESQRYEYRPDPDATPVVFTLRKNGRWVHEGEKAHDGTVLAIGYRQKYHDYSF